MRPKHPEERYLDFDERMRLRPIAAELERPKVRSFKDMTPEEQQALRAQYERPAKGTAPMDTRPNHAIAPIRELEHKITEPAPVSELEILGSLTLTHHRTEKALSALEDEKQAKGQQLLHIAAAIKAQIAKLENEDKAE